jgi:Phospholipase A2.
MVRLPCLLAVLGLLLTVAGAAVAAPATGAAPPAAPLFHGHWCGAGDENRAAPVDALDAACRAHDLCYERAGRGACACDKAFLKATARLIADPKTDEILRSKAATANSLFSATPCVEAGRKGHRAARR